jgi:myo-inositol-1(or 4)-monophosphatase
MHAILNIAYRAVRDAADALAHQFDRLDRIKVIDESDDNFMTSADLDADKTILYHLQNAFPDQCYSSRASGEIEGSDKSTLWLIEPLAGNRNFILGIPSFAISVACQIDQQIRHAVVIDPLLNEEFTTSRGKGAHLNGRRLRVTPRNYLRGGLTSQDSPTDPEQLETNLEMQRQLIDAGSGIRISGCTLLDILHTAAGRYDGGIGPYPGKQAMAAGRIILQETGGLISSMDGNPEPSESQRLVYGNPKCFKHLLKMTKTAKN